MALGQQAPIRLAAACALLLACGSSGDPPVSPGGSIRVAVLPDESNDRLRHRYGPLVEYLSKSTGVDLELSIPRDYNAFVDDFHDGRIDLAWFGGLTFAQAHAYSRAEPLVTRDVDLYFTSDLVVNGKAPAQELEAYRGRSFSYGPPRSTSGHLMPRAFFSDRDISPEEFFSSVRHSQGHDETARWVRDGVVEMGAINSSILSSMIADGTLSEGEVKILETTPPYQNYVWATRPGLSESVRLALRDAFLALDPSDPAHAEVLRRVSANGFLPIDARAYARLEEVARSLGLLEHEP